MQNLRNEFNQKNFTLTLEKYFQLTKYKLIQNIFWSCLMIVCASGVIISFFLLKTKKENSNIKWNKFLMLAYFSLVFLFVSISFLIWNSLLHFHLKKMSKNYFQKTQLNEHKQTIYYLTFHWIAKIYFSKKSIQGSLKQSKKTYDFQLKQNWSTKNQINSEKGPITDELETMFPILSLVFYILIGIFLFVPMLITQLHYWIGDIYRIKNIELVQENFKIITNKFNEFLIF